MAFPLMARGWVRSHRKLFCRLDPGVAVGARERVPRNAGKVTLGGGKKARWLNSVIPSHLRTAKMAVEGWSQPRGRPASEGGSVAPGKKRRGSPPICSQIPAQLR